MMTLVNALIEEVATLPTRTMMQAIRLAQERAAWEAEQAISQVEDQANMAANIAAKAITLAREIADLPSWEVAQAIDLANKQASIVDVIAAKTITSVTTTTLPVGATVAKMLALIDDLSVLPAPLASKARVLLGEIAFQGDDACAAFDWLAEHQCAIFGVELWLQIGNRPAWRATSDYQREACQSISPWEAYVRCCASGAKKFVERFANMEGALFNYSWGNERL